MRYVLLLALGACGVSEEAFKTQSATILCDLLEECEPEGFAVAYDSQSACRDDFAEEIEDDGCTFMPSEAAACLSDFRDLTCSSIASGNFPSSCEAVYDCEDEGDDLEEGDEDED